MRGAALDVVSAWKEMLLAVALGYVVWRERGLPFTPMATDWLAFAFAAIVVLYALIPQDWLGGEASARGIVFGARHALTPVAAYFLGRSLTSTAPSCAGSRRSCSPPRPPSRSGGSWTSTRSRCSSGATRASPAGSRSSSGSTTAASPASRRTSSTTPATSGRSGGSSRRSSARSPRPTCCWSRSSSRRRGSAPAGSPTLSGLLLVALLFTYSRTTIAALVFGLVVLAYALRSWWPVAAAAVLVAAVVLLHPGLSGHRAGDAVHARASSRSSAPAAGRRRRAAIRSARASPRSTATWTTSGTGSRRFFATRGATGSATPA